MSLRRLFLAILLSLLPPLLSAQDGTFSGGVVSSASSSGGDSMFGSFGNITLDEEAIRNIPKDEPVPEPSRPLWRNPLTIIALAVIAIIAGIFLGKKK